MTIEATRPTSVSGNSYRLRSSAPVPSKCGTKSSPVAPTLGRRYRNLLQISDMTTLTASAVLGAVTITQISSVRAGSLGIRDVLLAAGAMAVALHLHGRYRRPASRLRPSGWWGPTVIARCLPTGVVLALAVDALIFRGGRMTLTAAVAMALPAVLLVPFGRRLIVRMFNPIVTRILVVGTGPLSDRLTSRLQRCPDTVVVGHVDDDPAPTSRVLGGLNELPSICASHAIDRVIVAFTNASDGVVFEALRRLEGQVPISEVPRYFELHNWRTETEELHGLTLMHLPTPSLAASERIMKRLMDVTLATCALVLAAPLMLLVALAIKLDTQGPVFFRQERIGRSGKPFQIFKFRSMTADAWQQRALVAGLNETDGPLFKMEKDPRVTRVGALIRKTSIDELPQLINVVRGEMSLVGPRPLPTEESHRIDGAALARLDVNPGITGLWQVCGRSDLTYADLQHLDSAYVRSWSLKWDLRIMAQTPRVVFGHDGAY